jgi:hypothetical protein
MAGGRRPELAASGDRGGGPEDWCWWHLLGGAEVLRVRLHGLVRGGSRDLAPNLRLARCAGWAPAEALLGVRAAQEAACSGHGGKWRLAGEIAGRLCLVLWHGCVRCQ